VVDQTYEIDEEVRPAFDPLDGFQIEHTEYVFDSLPAKSDRVYLGVTNGLSLHTS
jgi:hypothetical protein